MVKSKSKYKCTNCGSLNTRINKTKKKSIELYCKTCKKFPSVRLDGEKVEIHGITPQKYHDFEEDILPYLKQIGKRASEKNTIERNQTITMPNGAFAIVMMSDVHGGAKADYEAIENDIKTIRDTSDMYCILAGDLTDNFIIGKLATLQKFQSTTFDDEMRFIEWFINILKGSLIAFISGNHDNWTKKMSAYDHLKALLDDVPILFDNNQVRFKLNHMNNTEQWLVRHKFKWSSIFNPTHGMQVTWERGEKPFDVVVGGHTHIATLCNEFIKHDIKRYAVLLGTYKLRDEYATECGFAHTHSDTVGSGAFVYDGKGNKYWCDSVVKAKGLLNLFKKDEPQ